MKRIESPEFALEIRQREIGRAQRFNEPCFYGRGERRRLEHGAGMRKCLWRVGERFCQEVFGSLFEYDAVIWWKKFERLIESTWPTNSCGNGAGRTAAYRSRGPPRLKIFCLAKFSRLDGNCCTDRVAIALCTLQAEADGVSSFVHDVAQNPNLRCVAIFEDDFKTAVVVQVGEGERAAVIEKVESGNAGDIGKGSIMIIAIEHIPLVSIPGPVRTDEFIDGVPAAFVRYGGECVCRRLRDHLPPKKARNVLSVRAGNVAVRYIKI